MNFFTDIIDGLNKERNKKTETKSKKQMEKNIEEKKNWKYIQPSVTV